MNDQAARRIVLDRLPPATFAEAVEHLDAVLRECQLVLVAQGQGQGRPSDGDLAAVASVLVPEIEQVADAFRAAQQTVHDDGTVRLVGWLRPDQGDTVARLDRSLVQLRALGRRGALLIESDPIVTGLLAWVWDEVGDQLAGRAPRPYRPAT